MINALNWIGKIHTVTFDYDEANNYFLKALKMAESNNDAINIAMLTNNIANIYSKKGQMDKAMLMFKKALILNEKSNHFQWAAINSHNIAQEFLKLNKLDSADKYMLNALSLINRIDDNYTRASILAKLGGIYILKDDLVMAKEYLHQADSIAKENKAIDILVEVNKSYAELFHQLNEPREEAKSLRKYKVLSDSLMSDRNTRMLAELKFKTNNEESLIIYGQSLKIQDKHLVDIINENYKTVAISIRPNSWSSLELLEAEKHRIDPYSLL